MAIQNSRSRKAMQKEQTMEQEAVIHSGTKNGVEKNAMLPDTTQDKSDSIALSKLLDKREKMLQGLNSVRSEREVTKQRLADLETSVARTEGALITLNQLIQEIDPQAAAQQMGG